MKYHLIKIIGIFLMLNLIINGVSGGDYVDDADIYYSEKLKAGMEFRWEIVKFEFNFTDEGSPKLDQSTTTTTGEVSTVIEVTTTATVDETTTQVGNPDENALPPQILPGTKYTVLLLKDLGSLSRDEYWQNSVSLNGEYFEASFSDSSLNDEDLFSLEGFIFPTDIRFENGTVLNYFEYQATSRQRTQDEFGVDLGDQGIKIEDGVVFQSINSTNKDGTFLFETRIDAETGVLLYASVFQTSRNLKVDILIVLDQTQGIDIDKVIANDDPTLSVPFSAMFIYSLILVPIVVNKFRRKSELLV